MTTNTPVSQPSGEAPERIWITRFLDSSEMACVWSKDDAIVTTQPGDYVAVRAHEKVGYIRAPSPDSIAEKARRAAARITNRLPDSESINQQLMADIIAAEFGGESQS